MSCKYWTSLYIVWCAFFFDAVVLTVAIPVLPTFLAKLNVSQTAIGALFASKGVAQMLSGPFWGWVVDRFGPRKPLFIGSVILCLSTLGFAFGRTYWFLFLARTVEGFASGSAFSSGMAYLSLVFEDMQERNIVIGWTQTGLAAGLICGPPFGGILYGLTGRKEMPFFVISGVLAVFAVSQLLIPNYAPRAEDVKHKTKEGEEASKEPYQGVWRLVKDPYVALVTVMYLLAMALISCIDPIFPIWYEKKFHVTSVATGLTFIVSTGAYALANPLVVRLGPIVGQPALMSFGSLFMGAALPTSALVPHLWQVIVAMFVMGASVACIDSSALPYMSDLVEARHSARYFGAMYSLTGPSIWDPDAAADIAASSGAVLGPLLGSILYDHFDYFIALYCFGIFAMVYAPMVVIFAWKTPPPRSLVDVTVN